MQPFDSIQASLAPMTDAPAPVGPVGNYGISGQFTFVPDEVRAIVKDWIELAREYDHSIRNADQLVVIVEPPGKDQASEFYVQRTGTAVTMYAESLIQKQEYCYNQAQKFQDALNDYLGVERQSVRNITSSGEPLPPSKPGGI